MAAEPLNIYGTFKWSIETAAYSKNSRASIQSADSVEEGEAYLGKIE